MISHEDALQFLLSVDKQLADALNEEPLVAEAPAAETRLERVGSLRPPEGIEAEIRKRVVHGVYPAKRFDFYLAGSNQLAIENRPFEAIRSYASEALRIKLRGTSGSGPEDEVEIEALTAIMRVAEGQLVQSEPDAPPPALP